jgi:hypothetical protein
LFVFLAIGLSTTIFGFLAIGLSTTILFFGLSTGARLRGPDGIACASTTVLGFA